MPGAWLAAALFALHPVEIESVAWITEMKNSLSMVFFLSSLLLYLRFDLKREWKFRAGSLLLFVLAMLSKTSVVPLPAVLLVIAWWKRGRLTGKHDCAPLIPFFLAGLVFSAITIWVERKYVGTHGFAFSFSLPERFLIVGRGILFYLGKIVWPSPLIFIYPRWEINAWDWRQYLFPVAVLALAGVLWLLRTRHRGPLAVFLYFVIMLVPVVGFISQWAFRFSFVADHWVNLASLGPIVFVSALAATARAQAGKPLRVFMAAACWIVIAMLAILTWKQCRMYADEQTLYQTILKKNPSCWLACNNLGIMFLDKGRADDAMAFFSRALKTDPDSAEVITNLGNALMYLGRTDEAIAQYRRAAVFSPPFINAWNDLGVALMKAGRTDESIFWYGKILEINDTDELVHFNLANGLERIGKPDAAIFHYLKALELNPRHVQAYDNLGSALLQIDNKDLATGAYLKSLAANPSFSMEVLNTLSRGYLRHGKKAEGIRIAEVALELAKSTGNTTMVQDIQDNLNILKGSVSKLEMNPQKREE